MSHEFVPVQWNRQKFIYDGVLLAAVLYSSQVLLYLARASLPQMCLSS